MRGHPPVACARCTRRLDAPPLRCPAARAPLCIRARPTPALFSGHPCARPVPPSSHTTRARARGRLPAARPNCFRPHCLWDRVTHCTLYTGGERCACRAQLTYVCTHGCTYIIKLKPINTYTIKLRTAKGTVTPYLSTGGFLANPPANPLASACFSGQRPWTRGRLPAAAL